MIEENEIILPELTPEQKAQNEIRAAKDYQEQIVKFGKDKFEQIEVVYESSEKLKKTVATFYEYKEIYTDDKLSGLAQVSTYLKII